MWQTLIATAPTPSVSQTIKQVVAGSSAIRRAVEALQKWGVQGVMEMSEEDEKLVTEWVEWLED
jgi:hypothetical protein